MTRMLWLKNREALLGVASLMLLSAACVAPARDDGSAPNASARQFSGMLTADTSRVSNSTFVLGESVTLTFQATGLSVSGAIPIAVRVIDEFGNQIAGSSVSMILNKSGNGTAAYMPPASKLGYFRVEAKLPNGTVLAGIGTRPAGFISYAIVPDPSKRLDYGDAGSRFGMQGGFNAAQGSVIPYLGIRYFLLGPGWRDLEPSRADEFATTRGAALAKGEIYPKKSAVWNNVVYNGTPWQTYAIPLLTTAKIPTWAIASGTTTKICPTMAALNSAGIQALPGFAESLAAEVAADYPNQSAHYYQITWEPATWCFGGTPQQLSQFYELSYAAIHRADPKAIVAGPTLFPENQPLMTQLWAAGLGANLDAVSIHPYVKWPPESNKFVDNIRSQMQLANAAKNHAVTFIGTEHGYTSGSIGELNEALGNIRATIILLGEGLKIDIAFYIADSWQHNATETNNTYGYYWNLNPKIAYGTDKISPKPSVPAFSAMSYWLDGTNTRGPIANLSGTQMGYQFQRNGTTILALWDYQAASSSANIPFPPGAVQICNWMGNCEKVASSGRSLSLKLGPSPTYVIGNGL